MTHLDRSSLKISLTSSLQTLLLSINFDGWVKGGMLLQVSYILFTHLLKDHYTEETQINNMVCSPHLYFHFEL